uniref:Transmembrane protein n=2 Tax=Rhizochromulina marina TaxID=1034831 RepID=A0A7S2SUF8_9STRA|mmetsp:Transcript_7487/g.21457  ORF Transcript_7487/g.21457 Transcript_7487/m.21457 type:complete len:210 (+) Transcript_7487:124-753(+)
MMWVWTFGRLLWGLCTLSTALSSFATLLGDADQRLRVLLFVVVVLLSEAVPFILALDSGFLHVLADSSSMLFQYTAVKGDEADDESFSVVDSIDALGPKKPLGVAEDELPRWLPEAGHRARDVELFLDEEGGNKAFGAGASRQEALLGRRHQRSEDCFRDEATRRRSGEGEEGAAPSLTRPSSSDSIVSDAWASLAEGGAGGHRGCTLQ